MQQAVRDALIAFMAATSHNTAEATKAAQRAGIEHAKASSERTYLGRKPTYSRDQLRQVRAMLGERQIATIARETDPTRQPVYRIQDDPADALRLLWLLGGSESRSSIKSERRDRQTRRRLRGNLLLLSHLAAAGTRRALVCLL